MIISKSHINLLIVTTICILIGHNGYAQHNAIVVDETTHIEIRHGWRTEQVSTTIQINDRESSDYAEIEIYYNDDEKLTIHSAEILNKFGMVVRKLKKKDIQSVSDISRSAFYQDNLVKRFSLKWHDYPYQVRYSYTRGSNTIVYVDYWHALKYFKLPTQHTEESVSLPLDYKVNVFKSDSIDIDITTIGNQKIYSWHLDEVKPVIQERYAPPRIELVPFVALIPESFHYGTVGSFASWKDYGQWLYNNNRNLYKLTREEELTVDKIVTEAHSDLEKIKLLYYYLQDNTRYINVSIDEGGLVPYPAEYVCKNKYGDCKALTVYMKAMLDHIGVKSYYTPVYGSSNPRRVEPTIPGQQFNHVILTIPMDNDTLWLENTANYLPFGYLGEFTANRYALFVDDSASRLIRTYSGPLSSTKISHTKIELSANGSGTKYVYNTYKDVAYESYADLFKNWSANDQDEAIRKVVKHARHELTEWSFKSHERDSAIIDLELNYTVNGQVRKLGSSYVIEPPGLGIPDFKKPDARRNPVVIQVTKNLVDSTFYDVSGLANAKVTLPASQSIESPYGVYQQYCEVTDKGIHFHRSFKLLKGRYSLEKYEEFYTFINQIHKIEHQNKIIFKKST